MSLKVLISGGGTGGHVYPALAIADALMLNVPTAQIKFIGALGRMEMTKVPQYGYAIEGLPISGFQRGSILKNLSLPFKILSSFMKVRAIIKAFKPDAVIGVGGYASWPLLHVASKRKIPSLIQEQNSYPGITNKMLAKKVDRICVAYEGLEKFFPKDKIVLTGNPVRGFKANSVNREEAFAFFGLNKNIPTVLVTGGSLGARTLNESLEAGINKLAASGVQIIWQTGSYYYESVKAWFEERDSSRIKIFPFIDRMDFAYAAADMVVSRAGAMSIAELALMHKPVILVPSPNVAEDHQTKNAMALVNNEAAIMVKDIEANEKLVDAIITLANDKNLQGMLAKRISKFAKPDASQKIVDELLKLINKN